MTIRDEPNIPGFGSHQNVRTDRGFARTFRTPLKSMGLERSNSKTIILKTNIQFNVGKRLSEPGSCPREHVSIEKNILKTDVFAEQRF